MVSTRPSEPMTMPEPSRSNPRLATVRPSGLMCVLMRTTAAVRSSSDVGWAGAATALAVCTTAASAIRRAMRMSISAIVGDVRAPEHPALR